MKFNPQAMWQDQENGVSGDEKLLSAFLQYMFSIGFKIGQVYEGVTLYALCVIN